MSMRLLSRVMEYLVARSLALSLSLSSHHWEGVVWMLAVLHGTWAEGPERLVDGSLIMAYIMPSGAFVDGSG